MVVGHASHVSSGVDRNASDTSGWCANGSTVRASGGMGGIGSLPVIWSQFVGVHKV